MTGTVLATATASGRRLLAHVRAPVVGVCLLTLAAAALRWPTLAGGSYWYDEWVTRGVVRRPLLEMLRGVRASESTPPLYYVLAWAWGHLFGTGVFALRSLSGLFGAATVPVAYAAGSALASRRAGLIAASFVAFNPLLVWYSTEARAYSLLVLLGALTVWFLVRALAEPGKRNLALWSLTCSLALTSHYFAAFVVVAEALVLLALRPTRRRPIAVALVPILATGLALLPLAYVQRSYALWIRDLRFGPRVLEIPRNFGAGVSTPTPWLDAAALVLVAAALLLLARADRRERRAAATAFSVGALALALPLVLAPLRDSVLTRNLLAAWFPLALAVAVACSARRTRVAGLALAAGLCAVGVAAVASVAADYRLQRVDWQSAARLLGPVERDRLVVAWGTYRLGPLGDELAPASELGPGGVAMVSELDLVGFDRPRGRISCWSGTACNVPRVRPRRKIAVAGFSLEQGRSSGRFEVLRFRARTPVRVTWRQVSVVDARYGPPTVWLQRRPRQT